jgi:hypothetical protein
VAEGILGVNDWVRQQEAEGVQVFDSFEILRRNDERIRP